MIEGLLKYESLINGLVDIVDIALLNDALDCRDENTRRLQAAT